MTQSSQSRCMMSPGIKQMSWAGGVSEELQQWAVSSWCRHCEEKEGPGDVQISSMFRYEEAEVVRKQKVGERERTLRVKVEQRDSWLVGRETL